MEKIKATAVVGLVLVVFATHCLAQNIHVGGGVTDSATGNPLGGAEVRLVELELVDTTDSMRGVHHREDRHLDREGAR